MSAMKNLLLDLVDELEEAGDHESAVELLEEYEDKGERRARATLGE